MKGASESSAMRLSNQGVLTLGVLLFVLGLVVRILPIPAANAHQLILWSAVTMAVTIFLVVSGIAFIVIALVKQKKGAKQDERESQCASAAMMSMQAQGEYNRRLAAFCKGGIAADEQT